MRNITLTIIVLILLGCNDKADQKTIDKFESILGTDNSSALTDLVMTFENDIRAKYETELLEDAYKLYLNDVINRPEITSSEWLEQLHHRDSIFSSCQCDLFSEIWMKPDSIWIDNGWTNTAYYVIRADDFKYDTMISKSTIHSRVDNIDSLISNKKKVPNFNPVGKYISAFDAIENTNKYTEWYVDTKNAAGLISPHITANLMLKNKADYNDYLIKRIIVIETYY